MEMAYIMPARCIECGGYFDLSFDKDYLLQEEQEDTSINTIKPVLCWGCR